MKIQALMIGINDYLDSNVSNLHGCENDVDLLAETLQRRFDQPDAKLHLKKLKSVDATRQSIIDAFQTHLIDQAEPGDIGIFYFSGHGSQSVTHKKLAPLEPDGLDESLVCYDSRYDGTPDLRDKDLRYLLKCLEQKIYPETDQDSKGHILVVFDCCHGGHGTRVLFNDRGSIRMAAANQQPAKWEDYLFVQQASQPLDTSDIKALLPETRHILLSSCRDDQVSKELPYGDDYRIHGIFTYALCEVLNGISYNPSYHELVSRVHARVQQKWASQSPQLEVINGARRDESVLGGKLLPLYWLVSRTKLGWKMNAGSVHDINVGDEIAILDPLQGEQKILSKGEV